MNFRYAIRRLLWKAGYDIWRFTPSSHPIARKKQLFESYRIDTVLDVGANTGQFAQSLRDDLGYTGRIISFEPLSSAFDGLQRNAATDPAWEVLNIALGDTDETQVINIAGNSYSSSILNMLPTHLHSAPESAYVGTETIQVRTLDSLFRELCKSPGNVFMKVDTQGFESRVLKGAERSLEQIDTVQLEVSLIPLYESELLLSDMCLAMSNRGYTLVALENGFTDEASGQLLQIDGIFRRLQAHA